MLILCTAVLFVLEGGKPTNICEYHRQIYSSEITFIIWCRVLKLMCWSLQGQTHIVVTPDNLVEEECP